MVHSILTLDYTVRGQVNITMRSTTSIEEIIAAFDKQNQRAAVKSSAARRIFPIEDCKKTRAAKAVVDKSGGEDPRHKRAIRHLCRHRILHPE
jgi:hypothetical protein